MDKKANKIQREREWETAHNLTLYNQHVEN